MVEVQEFMRWQLLVQSSLEWLGFVVEDLSIGQCPIAKGKHEERSKLEQRESSSVEFVVEHRRLPVVVSQAESLYQVEVEDSTQRDSKKDREEESVHKADVHLHQD